MFTKMAVESGSPLSSAAKKGEMAMKMSTIKPSFINFSVCAKMMTSGFKSYWSNGNNQKSPSSPNTPEAVGVAVAGGESAKLKVGDNGDVDGLSSVGFDKENEAVSDEDKSRKVDQTCAEVNDANFGQNGIIADCQNYDDDIKSKETEVVSDMDTENSKNQCAGAKISIDADSGQRETIVDCQEDSDDNNDPEDDLMGMLGEVISPERHATEAEKKSPQTPTKNFKADNQRHNQRSIDMDRTAEEAKERFSGDLFKVPAIPSKLSSSKVAELSLEDELACLEDPNFDEIELEMQQIFNADARPVFVGLAKSPDKRVGLTYCDSASPNKRIKVDAEMVVVPGNESRMQSLVKTKDGDECCIIEERRLNLKYFPPRDVYDCDVCCFLKFKTENERIQHLMEQAQHDTWDCDTCTESFNRPMELHRHKIRHHQSRKRTIRSRVIELF